MARLDTTTAALRWVATAGGTGQDCPMAIGALGAGRCLVSGAFSGAVDFGGSTRTGQGGADLFVWKPLPPVK